MRRLLNIFILFFGICFTLVVMFGTSEIECGFKKMFGIRCPGCGLTRAFREILHLNFYSAFSYNVLSIPLFTIGIVLCVGLIVDIVTNSNKLIIYLLDVLEKYYVIILILIIIITVLNNVNSI